ARREHVPAGQQVSLELLEVVDLAVQDDRAAPVFAIDGLVTARHIDDAEPPVAETHARPNMEAVGVRAPMPHDRGHPAEQLSIHGVAGVYVGEAGDPAHARQPSCRGEGPYRPSGAARAPDRAWPRAGLNSRDARSRARARARSPRTVGRSRADACAD